MKLWKRNAVVAVIALFVCMAVYLNWSYSQDIETSAEPDTGKVLGEATLVGVTGGDMLLEGVESGILSDDLSVETADLTETGGEADLDVEVVAETVTTQSGYFDDARLNRQLARDSALSLLQEAAADERADQVSVDAANQAIQAMATYTLSEAQIENLVMAKGYGTCVAFVGDSSASVVISSMEGGMSDLDTAKISEIVMDETGLTASQIKIIEAS